MPESSVQLHMLCPSLTDLPPVELPDGYRLRHLKPGEEGIWTRIVQTVFEDESVVFESVMRSDPAYCPERILFVEQNGEPVATTTAYYRPWFMKDTGMLHWVAVLPTQRGKRLGYWLTLAAMQRMREEGFNRAWLATDDPRLPAIKTYLKIGYEPLLTDESHRERWPKVFAELDRNDLIEQFADILHGPLYTPS